MLEHRGVFASKTIKVKSRNHITKIVQKIVNQSPNHISHCVLVYDLVAPKIRL